MNTPSANANAVKELVIASLFLTSRKITAGIEWAKTLKGQGAEVELGRRREILFCWSRNCWKNPSASLA